MSDQTNELPKDVIYKELTPDQELYLKKQLFYFLPFVRRLYQALQLEQQNPTNKINLSSVKELKDLTIYYANALVFGDFDLDKEQDLIDHFYETIGIPQANLLEILLSIKENTTFKEDGEIEDYFFGSKSTHEIQQVNLPGNPYEMAGAAEGIIHMNQSSRLDLVMSLSNHISTYRNNSSVAILGNVARGIIDAACIHVGLTRNNVSSSLHFYRVSPYAMGDVKPVCVNEQINKESWAIAADSFTAKGRSVPLSIELLGQYKFPRQSVFLTYGGYQWAKELEVEYQWPKGINQDPKYTNMVGTLLGGHFKS